MQSVQHASVFVSHHALGHLDLEKLSRKSGSRQDGGDVVRQHRFAELHQ
jgi:hypothetical protein